MYVQLRVGKQQHHYISLNTCTMLTEAEKTVYCFSFLLTSNFPVLQTLYLSASNRNHADSIWLVISSVTGEAGIKDKKTHPKIVKIAIKYSYNFYNDICPKCPFVWKMFKLFNLKKVYSPKGAFRVIYKTFLCRLRALSTSCMKKKKEKKILKKCLKKKAGIF